MKNQNAIKLFLGMILFMAILSTVTSCSESGKLGSDQENKIGMKFRAETADGITIAVFTSNPELHRIGDTVFVMTSTNTTSNYWFLAENPTYTKDTVMSYSGGNISYKRVVIKR
jgi:hypothetical protein